ncbi:MAG TPA: ketopantoate reductase C-terminal domain-containing protein, partial [Variovorax sp.]|nr:ketopantoate reductase C-terminal domain-containing protein [Variovorax sp.]
IGVPIAERPEDRHAVTRKLGAFKTSMLQDVEAGRAPEIDALVGSVAELARLSETPTPHIDTVYALVKLLAHGMEEAGSGVQMQPVG